MLYRKAKGEADKLAARKKETALDRKWDRIREDTFALIDKAAPFIDEDCPPDKWPPSVKLKLLYFVASTSGIAGGEKRAVKSILQLLDRARRLWVEGLHPDPFAVEPKVRL